MALNACPARPGEQIDMAVPLSPAEVRTKRNAILKHQVRANMWQGTAHMGCCMLADMGCRCKRNRLLSCFHVCGVALATHYLSASIPCTYTCTSCSMLRAAVPGASTVPGP
jgi:hypothetical protein